jgi:hypothetical protein
VATARLRLSRVDPALHGVPLLVPPREWTVLEPLLPAGKKPGRPRKWSLRQLIDGIRWRTWTGSPWRDVPELYGPWLGQLGQ